MTQFVDASRFHDLARSGQAVGVAVRRATTAAVQKFLGVGERDLRVIATTPETDLVGDIVEPKGGNLNNFRRNAIVLAQHDPSAPIARCSYIGLENDKIVATISFPPPGTSEKSDEYLRLCKAGIVSACSIGFLPTKWLPIKNAGLRFVEWILLELSLVSVPANPSALVTERSFRRAPQTVEERRWEARELARKVRLEEAHRLFLESRNLDDLRHARYVRDRALST